MSKPIVWTLNYHEVTRDPRVLKQARTLAAAGYDVTVFCDLPEGLAKYETTDGVKIHRFDWKNLEIRFDRNADIFRFLRDTCQDKLADFESLIKVAEEYHGIFEGIPNHEKLQRSYYGRFKGAQRAKRKREYLGARLKYGLRGVFDRRYRQTTKSLNKVRKLLEREAGNLFRDLYQAKGLVFAANLLEEDLGPAPSVIHAHDIYTLPAGVALAQKYGCRLIYDAHELEIERATNYDPESADFVDRLEMACLSYVDALITVSDSIGEVYSERFPRKAPVIIMNAPEVALIPEEAIARGCDVRSRAGLDDETPLIIYTGGIQREHRGLDKVVAALAKVPDVHLATMGARHPTNDLWLKGHVEKHGVADRVHLLDGVPANEVVGTISSATAAIIPIQGVSLSYQMAMPNKLFEAAIARLPILVSDLPDMRRFVEELGLGIVMDHESPDGIAAAIRELLESGATIWGNEETDNLLEERYSWPAQEQKLRQLYRDLLSEPVQSQKS